MTDAEAKTLLKTLEAPCPVVSIERRREVLHFALQAIEDRAKLVAEYANDPSGVVVLAARRHIRGETPAEPNCSDCTTGRDGDCAICKPLATPQEKP